MFTLHSNEFFPSTFLSRWTPPIIDDSREFFFLLTLSLMSDVYKVSLRNMVSDLFIRSHNNSLEDKDRESPN